jgi:two-component system response regulator MprA
MSDRKKRVLAVDDDELIRTMLSRVLSSAYDVVVARNGEEALQEIRREKPDLVVLDLRMPVMDGWQLLDRLEESGDDVPVVILSAEAGKPWPESPLVRARHPKPGGMEALRVVCARVLAEADAKEEPPETD